MRSIRLAVLTLAGLAAFPAFGQSSAVPTPEFYGVYVVVGGKALELNDANAGGRTKTVGSMMSNTKGLKRLSGIRAEPSSYFLVYGPELRPLASQARLVRMDYRDKVVLGTGMIGDPKASYAAQMWVLESTVKVRVGPVAGNPDLQRIVPSEPLKDGAYGLMAGEFNSGVPFGESGVLYDFQIGDVRVETPPTAGQDSRPPKRTVAGEASAPHDQRGEGGLVIVDNAVIYRDSTGQKIAAKAMKGQFLGGVTARGLKQFEYRFARDSGRVQVLYFEGGKPEGLPKPGWIDAAAIKEFSFDCSCASDCNPGEKVSFLKDRWSSCFKAAAEKAAAEPNAEMTAESATGAGTATTLKVPDPLKWGAVPPAPHEVRLIAKGSSSGPWSAGAKGELRFGDRAFDPEVSTGISQPAEWKVVRDASGRWAVAIGGRGVQTALWGLDLETGRSIPLQDRESTKGPTGEVSWKPGGSTAVLTVGGSGGRLVLFDGAEMKSRASGPLVGQRGVRQAVQKLWWAGDGIQLTVLDECPAEAGRWQPCKGANPYLLGVSLADMHVAPAGSLADRERLWKQFFVTQDELLEAAPPEAKDGKADQLVMTLTGKAKSYRSIYTLALLLREQAKEDLRAAKARLQVGDLAGTAFYSGRSVRDLAQSNEAAKAANLAWGDSRALAAVWTRFVHDAATLSAEVVLTTFAFNPATREGFSTLFMTTSFVADQEMYGCEAAIRNLLAKVAQNAVSRKLGLAAEAGGVGWDPGPVLGKGVVAAAYAAQKKAAAAALVEAEQSIFNEMQAQLGSGTNCLSRDKVSQVIRKTRDFLVEGNTSQPEQPTPVAAPALQTMLVTKTSIGPLRIGMTLGEARKVLAAAHFERTTSGDGLALVKVDVGGETLMLIYADEGDPESPVDWSKKVQGLWAFHPSCRTAGGVHPGSSVEDAIRAYGRVKEIFTSEIESREFISFESAPEGLVFRLDNSGVYKENARTTTQFKKDARILAIYVGAG